MAKRTTTYRNFFRSITLAPGAERFFKAAPPPGDDDQDDDGDDQDPDDTDDTAGGDDAADDRPATQSPLSGDPVDAPDEGPDNVMPDGRVLPEKPADIAEAKGDPKSLFWDPFAVIDALGYKEKASPVTWRTLKEMQWKMPVIQAIIRTRLRQIQNFSQPQGINKYKTGFRLRLRDEKARPSTASEAHCHQYEQWLMSTGTTQNPAARDDFSTFLQKIVEDSLAYDQLTFEVIPSRKGVPAAFYAVDAATFRLADTTKLFLDPEDKTSTRFVQVYDGQVIEEFSSEQLCFGVRNPTSDIRMQGYGQSELEMLVGTVTSLLYAWDYNKKFFSQGTSAKGIINFKGAVSEKQLNAFRRHWYLMASGIENAFKTPIVNSEDMQWIDLGQSNKDMEFSAWMDFLIKVASGIYGMDPMEINFKYGDTGARAMFESATQSKLTASKDKGLKPLLQFLENKINLHLIQPLDEDFCFEFVGLEANTPGEQADVITKQVKSFKTVDEARAEEGMPPMPNGRGDVILDPVFMQHMTQSQQAESGTGAFAPPQPPPGAGDPDADPDDPFNGVDLSGGDDGGGAPPGGSGGDAPAKPAAPDGVQKSRRPVAAGRAQLRKSAARKPATVLIDIDV